MASPVEKDEEPPPMEIADRESDASESNQPAKKGWWQRTFRG
jgi:hypothetical protein